MSYTGCRALTLNGFYARTAELRFIKPSNKSEQYTTDNNVLKQLQEKIPTYVENKGVIDLGCGTGIISIFCKLLGASNVLAIDAVPDLLNIGKEFASRNNLHNIDWLAAPIEFLNPRRIRGSRKFDTAISNPPFGVWRKGLDKVFVRFGMAVADVVISFHKENARTSAVFSKLAKRNGFSHETIISTYLLLDKTMSYHVEDKYPVKIAIYKFQKQK